MKRDKTPHILPVTISGYPRFRVTFWTAEGRHREHYSTLALAENRVKELKKERTRFGEAAANMSAELRADAISAAEILTGTGYTLVEAARRLVESKAKEAGGKELVEAVTLFLGSRKTRGKEYRSDLTRKLKQFACFFEGRNVSSIEIDDCQRFLDATAGTQGPTSVANYRRTLSMFFKYASLRRWCSTNPAALTAKVDAPPATITILSVAEARRIMQSCPREIRAGVALQLFCGIRAAEIARVEWSAIQHNVVEERVKTPTPAAKGGGAAQTPPTPAVIRREFYTITVTVETSKKRVGRRVVQIPDNAMTWIKLPKKRSGKIWPAKERARDLWTLARVLAGYGPYFTDYPPAKAAQLDARGKTRKSLRPWPKNALRRSAISYHLAKTNDLPVVAYQAGNSPAVIQKHYNGLALPQDAANFYEIRR